MMCSISFQSTTIFLATAVSYKVPLNTINITDNVAWSFFTSRVISCDMNREMGFMRKCDDESFERQGEVCNRFNNAFQLSFSSV